MREKMILLVREMVQAGRYYLVNESVEQFVDRMISYGFDTSVIQEWHDKFTQMS